LHYPEWGRAFLPDWAKASQEFLSNDLLSKKRDSKNDIRT
jgi:hypothetical protein